MIKKTISKFLASMMMSVMLFNSAAPYYVKAEGEETVITEENLSEDEVSEDDMDRDSFTEDGNETNEDVLIDESNSDERGIENIDEIADDKAESEVFVEGDFEYTTYEESGQTYASIAKYKGPDTVVNIPTKIGGYTVASIDWWAFSNHFNLTEVKIPDTVVKICNNAFENCTKLSNIELPSQLKELGAGAFAHTDIKSVKIPKSLEKCGRGAFSNVDLEIVEFEEGITTICEGLFSCSNITTITIPESVTSIQKDAFYKCEYLALTSLPDSITYIGESAFFQCGKISLEQFPSNLKTIESNAFCACDSLNISVFPDGLTKIGEEAFESCDGLTDITIPDSVVEIGGLAFRSCENIEHIVVPGSVVTTGYGSFCQCPKLITAGPIGGDYSLEYGWSEEIPSNAFSGMGQYTTSGESSGLQSIIIPKTIKKIGDSAFYGCSLLKEIDLPNSVIEIGDSAFSGCRSLKEIVIPNGIVKIGDETFCYCKNLQKVVLPDGLEKIGDSAFSECRSLKEINLPNSVVEIGNWAFRECDNLQNVVLPENLERAGNEVFSSPYIKSIIIPKSMIVMGESYSMFHNCKNLETVVFEEGIMVIPENALRGCEGVRNITIPEGVTKIRKDAFSSTYIVSIDLPDSLEYIDVSAMESCVSLNSIIIPQKIKSIDRYTFSDCVELKSILIPESVTYINNYAFERDEKLTIYGYEGSYAQGFAKLQGIPFVALDKVGPDNGEGFDLKEDGYCVVNWKPAFSYDSWTDWFGWFGYKIPLERYQEVYGDTYTNHIYNQNIKPWNGSCFGMSATAVMFHKNMLQVEDYVKNDVSLTDGGYDNMVTQGGRTYLSLNNDAELTKLIERYQIWAQSTDCERLTERDILNYRNGSDAENFEAIISEIETKKEPFILCVQWTKDDGSSAGHALVVDSSRAPEDRGKGWTRVYLYDPNNPYFDSFGDKTPLSCYNQALDRFIELNTENGQWRMEVQVNGDGDSTPIGYDNLGNRLRDSIYLFVSVNEYPVNFDKKAGFTPSEGNTGVAYASSDFSVCDSKDNLLYQKKGGATIYIDSDVVRDNISFGYTEGCEDGIAAGTLILPQGQYRVSVDNGMVAYEENGDYIGVTVKDNPITVFNTETNSLSVIAHENADVDIVVMDVYSDTEFSSVKTDLIVNDKGCDVSVSRNILNIDADGSQVFNIDIITNEGEGEIIGVSTNAVTNLVINAYIEEEPQVYTISYDLDGGQTVDNPTSYTCKTGTFTLNNPTKEGYEFLGWTGANGNEPEVTVVIGKGTKGDLFYKANWGCKTATATDITLSEIALTIKKGNQIKLTVYVKPDNAQYGSLSWNSTDPSVASVDGDGLVSAIKEGNTTVTVRIDGTDLSASCNITVVSENDIPISVNRITLDKEEIKLIVGGNGIQLNASIEPEGTLQDRLIWSSSDEAIATVSDNGLVSPVAKGTAVITVSADGCKAECKVVVTREEVSIVHPMNPVPEIDETTTELYLIKGQKFTLPDSGWTSANKKYVTISKKNVLTAKKVTAEGIKITKDGREITIYTSQPKMVNKTIKLDAGKEQTISLDYDADNLPILWYSNAPDVATISQEGMVTAHSKGTATITAYIFSKAYTCKVKVAEPQIVQERTIHVALNKNKTVSLKGIKKPIWKPEDETVVSVKGSKFKGLKAGDTIVSTEYEGKTYQIHVYVEDPTIDVTGLNAKGKDKYTAALKAGDKIPLSYNFVEQDVVFKSSKGEVAYWDDDAIVAQTPGKAKLTAKVNGKTITINVTVN